MSGKNICISCISKGFGGLEINTLQLASWLRNEGWRVSLLLLKDSRMRQAAPAYCNDILSIPGGYFLKWRKLFYLRDWIKKRESRIFFTAFNKDIAAAALYKRFCNKKLVIVYQQQMKVGVDKRDLVHRLRYQMVDRWISPLHYLKEETIRRTTIPAEKISVIPLCIEGNKFFDCPLSRTEARVALDLPADKKIIGVLGRLDPEKGQDFLIRCISRLKTGFGMDYTLLIMGEKTIGLADDYNRLLQELVTRLAVSGSVCFRPFSSQVEVFYKAIDVFAMASKAEPFGMVVIEAMASGCPVISVNRDGPAEILANGELGYLYEYRDEADFAAKLQEMEGNPQLPVMLNKAREKVRESYTRENLCAQLDSLFHDLLID